MLQERFWTIDGPTGFLEIDTEGDKTICTGSLFQYFTTLKEKAPTYVLAVIGRYALVARLGVGGGRSQTG